MVRRPDPVDFRDVRFVLSRGLALHVYAWARERGLRLSDVAQLAHVHLSKLASAVSPSAPPFSKPSPEYIAMGERLRAMTAWKGGDVLDRVEVTPVEK